MNGSKISEMLHALKRNMPKYPFQNPYYQKRHYKKIKNW